MLQAVLASPRPTSVRRRGKLQLAPVGLALALAAGVLAVSVTGGERSGDEQEAAGGSGGGAIIHYVVRESWDTPDGPRQPAFTHERWQLEDATRARTISHSEEAGPMPGKTSENVVTSTQTLTYLSASGQESASIIRYRSSDDFQAIPEDPPTFAAPPIGGSPDVGDPRTVPDRLADGDEDVTQLADATVRGVAVEQFQVGECDEPANTEPRSDANAGFTVPQRAIVALARDTRMPVRVAHEPCTSDGLQAFGTRILDYVSFEELVATPENMKLLDMSPHPGVPIVDGIEIDKAEERDAGRPAPTPTPTPTPDGPRTGG